MPVTFRSHSRESWVVEVLTVMGEVAAAFLDEPQTGDVFEKAKSAGDAELIGIRSGLRDWCYARFVEFRAQQGPGAARYVTPLGIASGGHRGNRAGRIVRGWRNDAELRWQAGLFREFRTEWANVGGRLDRWAEDVRGNAQLGDHVTGPITGMAIDHLACRRDGSFCGELTAKPVVEQIGNEEQSVGGCEGMRIRPVMCVKRIEGVERHELDAGGAVDAIRAEFRHDFLVSSRVARIAVGVRQTHELARFVDKGPIDAPGIDADGSQLCTIRFGPFGGATKAVDDVSPDSGNFPVQPGWQPNRFVEEAVDLFHAKLVVLERTDDDSAGLGAKINGDVRGGHAAYRIMASGDEQRVRRTGLSVLQSEDARWVVYSLLYRSVLSAGRICNVAVARATRING